MSVVMVRPKFAPSTRQQRLMARLGQQRARIEAEDARLTSLIVEAKEQGIPIEHIAPAAGIAVKTVYNRLARMAEAIT